MAEPDYHAFTSARATEPDPGALLTALRVIEPTIGVQHQPGTAAYRLKKNTAWTPAEIAQAQTAIDTAPVRDEAALEVDQKVLKAIVLGLWECIPNPTMTKVQLRARVIAIWKTL
jgi:hypothetical protein